MAAGGIAVAAALALGVAGASAQTPAQLAPNPGVGYNGTLPGTPETSQDEYPSPTPVIDGPQTANVPTLAWAGEAVKLVACGPRIYPGYGLPPGLETANWSTENWTGDQGTAQIPTLDGQEGDVPLSFTQGSNGFFLPTDYQDNLFKGCVTATIKSTHSGLWQGKLNVYETTIDDASVTEYTEQFIVIWMNPTQPTITESSVSSLSYPGGSTVDQISTVPGVGNVTGGQCVDGEAIVYGPTGPPQGGDPSGLPLSGPWNCFGYLGDPSGNGMFNPSLWPICAKGTDQCVADVSVGAGPAPGNNNGLIDIRVTGTFPVEDLGVATSNEKFFGSIDGGTNPGLITLPAQWPALAGLLADSSTAGSSPGSDPNLWDIHGGPTNADTHPEFPSTGTIAIPCPADTFGAVFDTLALAQTLDAVNNCLGSDLYFSRVFGDVTSGNTAPGGGGALPSGTPGIEPGPTVGPYDDEAPNETLLSDGRLNTDDAPMPALPVTVSIAPNLGGTDLGGVGGLYSADKELIYSHNFDANKSTLGNLYNPYYYEYIPSTSRGYAESSGITGVAGDNFPGFDLLNQQPYKFWTALDPSSNNGGNTDTICLRRSDGGSNSQSDGGPEYYGEPDTYQADSVIVYTDERGEAFVDYNPGDGFYLDNLIQPDPPSSVQGGNDTGGPVVIGDNGSCDLQKLLGKEIGYSAITASAQYPYQGVDYANPPASSTLTKVVNSLWNKTLSAYPSITGGDTSDFVTTATDINGQPFGGEIVCFSVQGTPSGAFTGLITGISSKIQNSVGGIAADTIGEQAYGENSQYGNGYCVRSNWLGEAGIQVSGSVTGVDVTALFVDEQVERDLDATLGGGYISTGTPPVGATVIPQASPVSTTGTTGGSSTGGSNVTIGSSPVTTTGPVFVQKAKTANVYKVEGLRLVRGKHGKYAAIFKLSGARGALSVTIRAYRANGKLLRTYRITVRANTVVSVNVGTKVAHVTVIA
jgi:hypothetical protein